ncbi:uncharacterized protein LOC113663934 isoform X1 [Tachysurus fulvidraco]|uniref:uncharacterized protein LOC113663934 isoform X1 n=1 Tax=Tachysurus fulvidraco TaxID=1234273 RepID=UPI001FEF05FD|nr:uncharacterized protein LOC113663934 isoform X1 [Tachysurus fulvidraco]XP_027035217.2 uncharacterized protein LOC113663934 isoform X1 [Tachysurus fulvidraco]XP_027035219.2 uncharacterized protein LOC113663934 isoform X1 [Tachysurus fulvidraco]XP_047678846.1 uncharacterized protein LOC113663934 isoform X1 [Tachysurus fulvidraco]XP_047678847.1 uncharacterized protein LOC113663934 isoform X1 [Tachysurus fulvidraco]
MQHPNDGVPCDRGCSSTTSWSFSVSQGLHLHVSDRTTASSSKALRKYDFRLLTPSTGGTFHRRGLAASGTSSSVTQKGRSLMACGRRCVLSLRPGRCGNKTEKQKSKEAEESEGGKSAADGMVDESRKAGEEKKRARSCVARTRATVTSDARPSTAPAHTRAGRSDINSLEETPGYSVVWRHRDPADCPSTGNPVLHLYLPDYRIDPRKETDEASDAETDQKTGEIRSQPQEKEGAADVLEDVMTTETGSEQKCNVEENDERRRSGQNELDEIEMNKRGGVREESPDDITQEPGEKRSTEHSGKSDDRNQCAADVFKERPKAPDVKLKSKDRNSGQDRTRRPTLPASALFIPGTLGRTRSSPSSCMLPPFYGSSFGHSIRTPHTPERHRAKTHLAGSFSFDKRAIKSVTQKPPSWDSTGNRLVFKTEPRGITGPRPKILSCERWGPLPRKTKTTKTFVWGPRGPQESKSVCELHARTNRWRGED